MAYGRQRPGYQGRRQPQEEQKPPDLSFLDNGFYEKDNLREDLLDDKARVWGQKFATKKSRDEVSSTQIRRFYGDVKALGKEMRQSGINMNSINCTDLAPYKARIKMLKSKVSYASSREKVSPSFQLLIEKCVNNIKHPKDFTGFVLFFESLLGYYYYYDSLKSAKGQGGETSYE